MGDPSSFAGNGGRSAAIAPPPIRGNVAAVTSAANPTTHATRRGGLDLVL